MYSIALETISYKYYKKIHKPPGATKLVLIFFFFFIMFSSVAD